MPNWGDLRDNQLVDRNALLDAIANNFQTLQDGQSVPAGERCVSVAEAQTWLKLDQPYLPTTGRMPIKSEFVPAYSSIRIKFDEQATPNVDINAYVSVNDISIASPSSDSYDNTFTFRGGSVLSAAISGLNQSTAPNPQKHLRVTENGVIIYDSTTPSPGLQDVWYKRILAGASYFIEMFSTGNNSFPFLNKYSLNVNWELKANSSGNVINSGVLAGGATWDIGVYLTSYPNCDIYFYGPIKPGYTTPDFTTIKELPSGNVWVNNIEGYSVIGLAVIQFMRQDGATGASIESGSVDRPG